jgi:outer membrane protein assembly factor BamB
MSRLLFLLILILPFGTKNPDKYEWRGKNRAGIYSETGLLKKWPEAGPKELWSVSDIGNGYVSPVFTDKNFFITGEIDTVSVLYCFNLQGQKLWQMNIGKEWIRTNRGSRSTPTIVGDLLYVGTGMGNLYCVDIKSHKILWSKDFVKDFNGIMPLHGHSEAPAVDGDVVFWTPGGKDFNVVAMNRFTGKLIWSDKGFSERSAYNSPLIFSRGGKKIIVTFSAYHMMGLDAETGKLLWSDEQTSYPPEQRKPGYGDTHANTVIYDNGFLYYAEGDGNCGAKFAVSEDGNSIKRTWQNPGFDSYMGGVVKIGNYLYGSGTVKPELRAINSETGVLTDSLRVGSGAIISAENLLYYYNQKGELHLLGCDNGKMSKISSFRITKGTEQHFAHPVINKGVLYQRHGKVLMAFDIKN